MLSEAKKSLRSLNTSPQSPHQSVLFLDSYIFLAHDGQKSKKMWFETSGSEEWHNWACSLKQQSSITVYGLPTKESKLLLFAPVCS
jgi:hypothetical protein